MAEQKDLTTLVLKFVAQTNQLDSSIKRVETEVKGLEGTMKSSAARIGKYFAGAFAGVSVLAGLKAATKQAVSFGAAMAEVSTLLDDTGPMEAMTAEVKKLAVEFGFMPVTQAKALYSIISSGAKAGSEAIEILTAANKLARGGVTDVATAARGLVNVLNAYGLSGEHASDVSDTMFVAMKAGQTTIAELSDSLGKVSSVAKETGVSFEELAGAVAASTKIGLETRLVVNALRGILQAIVKPAAESRSEFAKQGIAFGATALQGKKLSGVLTEIRDKTKGDIDIISKLFPERETLPVLLALLGSKFEDFIEILGNMETKTGQTEIALGKLREEADFTFDTFKAAIAVLGIDIGEKILGPLTPAVAGLVKHFDTVIKVAGLLVAVVVSRLVTAIVTYAATMVSAIGPTTVLEASMWRLTYSSRAAAIAMGTAAAAARGLRIATGALGGPLGLIITLLTAATTAWVLFGREAEKATVDRIAGIEKMVEAIGKSPALGEAEILIIGRSIEETERKIDTLERERKTYEEVTDNALTLLATQGDPTPQKNLRDINTELLLEQDNLARLNTALVSLKDKMEELKKAGAVEVAKPAGKTAAELKAEIKISEALAAEEVDVLEASYKRGEIDLEEYFLRRRQIIIDSLGKEVNLLRAEAETAEPDRVAEIRAELVVKESKARRELITLFLRQESAEKAINTVKREGLKIRALAAIEEDQTRLQVSYDKGLISAKAYYTERRRLSEEANQKEIAELEAKFEAEEKVADQLRILTELESARARQRIARIELFAEEDVASKTVLDEERRISDEFIALRGARADTEFGIVQAQQGEELRQLRNRFSEERRMVEDHKGELIRLGEEYYTKETALAMLASEEEQARQALLAQQSRETFAAKLGAVGDVFGMWSEALGQAFDASGGKIKEFFELQKAFSIVETTIKTYQAAVDAYRAMVGIPVVGPALATAAAAAAIAFGLAQVATISRQTPPGYEKGGLIRQGSGMRDDVPIRVKRHEYVVRSEAVKHYGPEFMEAVNRMSVPLQYARFKAPVNYAPRVAFAEGGLVTGGVNVSVAIPDTTLARKLERGIERTVVRILRETS